MLYYIPNLFVTMTLVLGVKSRWEGNVSRLREGLRGPSAPSRGTGHARNSPLVSKGLRVCHSHPVDTQGGLSHRGRRWPLSTAEGMACLIHSFPFPCMWARSTIPVRIHSKLDTGLMNLN